MKKKTIDFTQQKPLNLDGFITIQLKDDGLHTADFQCCEDVQMEPFAGNFRVQGMRDGNIYMNQIPKRIRNKPKFREDHSSLSLTSHRKVFVVFCESVDDIDEIPKNMVKEVRKLAKKLEALIPKLKAKVLNDTNIVQTECNEVASNCRGAADIQAKIKRLTT